MESFYFVWNPQGNVPRHMHPTQEDAVREAERLARMNRGQEFIVLESVVSLKCDDLVRRDMRPAEFELPF